MPQDISYQVCVKLGLKISGEEEKRLTKRYTDNPEAFQLYLQGKYHQDKYTEEGILTAKKFFQRALDKDPNFAPAYVGLGDCCILLGALYEGPLKTYEDARKHYQRAELLDKAAPGLPTWRAPIYMFLDWDWQGAEKVFETEHLDLDPFHAFYLASQGKADAALKVMQEYGDMDALAPAQRNELAMAYNWGGTTIRLSTAPKKRLNSTRIFHLLTRNSASPMSKRSSLTKPLSPCSRHPSAHGRIPASKAFWDTHTPGQGT
jgi:hypothetical protein